MFTDTYVHLSMHKNISGRVYWLLLKGKPEKLGIEKANFSLNILVILYYVILYCYVLCYAMLLFYVCCGTLYYVIVVRNFTRDLPS